MQVRPRHALSHHLQRVIDHKQRRRERVADPREPAARRGVRLEDHELLLCLLRDAYRVQVRREKGLGRAVGEEQLQCLVGRGDFEAGGWERRGAVARGVAVGFRRLGSR